MGALSLLAGTLTAQISYNHLEPRPGQRRHLVTPEPARQPAAASARYPAAKSPHLGQVRNSSRWA